MPTRTHTFKVGMCYFRGDYPELPIWGEVIESNYPEDREQCRRTHTVIHRGYSDACIEGELGMMPEVESEEFLLPVGRELFDIAREAGWPSLHTAVNIAIKKNRGQ